MRWLKELLEIALAVEMFLGFFFAVGGLLAFVLGPTDLQLAAGGLVLMLSPRLPAVFDGPQARIDLADQFTRANWAVKITTVGCIVLGWFVAMNALRSMFHS